MIARRPYLLILAVVVASCRGGPPPPAAWTAGAYACQYCRMMVIDQRFASQIVAPYEEPRVFDDLGCLANYLKGTPTLPAGAVTYVADHRTRTWVPAHRAVYSRVATLTAPMGSHVVAHETAASRDADAEAAGRVAVDAHDEFPTGWPGEQP